MPAERLAAMRLIVTPGTILRWRRDIVRRRWRLLRRGRSGRPATHCNARSAVLRLAALASAGCGKRIFAASTSAAAWLGLLADMPGGAP